jgi:hypothetical protein
MKRVLAETNLAIEEENLGLGNHDSQTEASYKETMSLHVHESDELGNMRLRIGEL